MTQLVTRKPSFLARLARRTERGMTTSEYAVGTVAVVLFGGVLVRVLTDDEIARMIGRIVLAIIQAILNLLGATL